MEGLSFDRVQGIFKHPYSQKKRADGKPSKPSAAILRLLSRFGWRTLTLSLLLTACGSPTPVPAPTTPSAQQTGKEFTVGLVLIGPKNDGGWNQAHYEGMQTVVKQVPGVKFDYVDKVNPADRPNVTGVQVADGLIAKGAQMVIFNSDDMKDDALETAKKYPNLPIIHASGDYAWKEGKNFKNQPNLGNIMGRMEYGKMMAGCAAALSSNTGQIGYLGPLINDETRRLVASAYLGAQYCWQNYRQKNPADLKFKVTWIGFWFNIPGKTLDPTKVADDFFNRGYDVVISGIDTPEAAVQAKKAAAAGKPVKFVHYDLKTGCDLAPGVCLGVPYFNWNIPYQAVVQQAIAGKMPNQFIWLGPDWKDINNPQTSMIGFLPGKALGETNQKFLNQFIQGLGDGSIVLFKGPLNFQNGQPFLKAGETATDQQIWYLPQLLSGMEGPSQ
jgi:simple sugar transport system substrate-binding protein